MQKNKERDDVAGANQAREIARSFLTARREAAGLPGYPGEVPQDLDAAYAIQDAAIADSGKRIGGWKVGRIMPPLSAQYGSDRLAGPIFSDMIHHASDESVGRVFADGFAAAEAEFLLRIGSTLTPGKSSFTLEEAADMIDAVHIGVEIASSPLASINDLGPAVTISDFGNNNGLIIGPEVANWRASGLEDVEVSLSIDEGVAGTGRASAFPDGLIGSVRFLLQNVIGRGIAIERGCWISSGAVTGVHQVRLGQQVVADFGSFGAVSCVIEAQQGQAA